jgi:hypothetical protein
MLHLIWGVGDVADLLNMLIIFSGTHLHVIRYIIKISDIG